MESETMNWIIFISAIVAVCAGVWAAVHYSRKSASKTLVGINGWLAILFLNVCIMKPIAAIILMTMRPLGFVVGTALLALGIVTAIKMLQHKRVAVRLIMTSLMVWMVADLFFFSAKTTGQAVVSGCIWLVYLSTSKRVQATFNPLPVVIKTDKSIHEVTA